MWTCSGIAVTSTFSLFSVLSVHILVFLFKGWGGFSIYIDILKTYDGKINYVDHETINRSHFRKKKISHYTVLKYPNCKVENIAISMSQFELNPP